MYRKVPVRLGKRRWETYTTTVVKGTHRFLHGCYGLRNALLGTTKTADLTRPCPIKSDGYPSRILYSVSLQALKNRLKFYAGYCATKAGMDALCKVTAIEYGPKVCVYTTNPGFVNTPLIAPLTSIPEVMEVIDKSFNTGRIGKPEDFAHLVKFLCSDEAGFITGTSHLLDKVLTMLVIWTCWGSLSPRWQRHRAGE